MQPGDTLYLKAGVYREALVPTLDGSSSARITISGAPGENAIIDGADVVTGWSSAGAGVSQADVSWDLGAGNNQVLINDTEYLEAAYPDPSADQLIPNLVNSTVTDSTATMTGLPGTAADWVGAVYWGSIGLGWSAQASLVGSSSTGTTLQLTPTAGAWFENDGQARLIGVRKALTTGGEWIVESGKLLLIPPTGISLSSATVSMKRRSIILNLDDKDYVTVSGIEFRNGRVSMQRATNCRIERSTFKRLNHLMKVAPYDRVDGILMRGSKNVLSRCTITGSSGAGVILNGTDMRVEHCTISRINYGGSYNGGVHLLGSGHVIYGNAIFDVGREAIYCDPQTPGFRTITYNHCYRGGRIAKDCGVFYAWTQDLGGTEIAFNWFHDNINPDPRLGPVVYFDFDTSNAIVHHNVIFGSGNSGGDAGIRFNGGVKNIQVYHNTMFSCNDVGTKAFLDGRATPEFVAKNNLWLGNISANAAGASLVDPVTNDYSLKSSIVANIDKGSDTAYSEPTLGNAPDLGAYELNAIRWIPGPDPVVAGIPGSGSSTAGSATGATSTTGTGTTSSSGSTGVGGTGVAPPTGTTSTGTTATSTTATSTTATSTTGVGTGTAEAEDTAICGAGGGLAMILSVLALIPWRLAHQRRGTRTRT